MLFHFKDQTGYVSDLIDYNSEREKEALVNGALRTGNHSIYFSETNVDGILADGAAVLNYGADGAAVLASVELKEEDIIPQDGAAVLASVNEEDGAAVVVRVKHEDDGAAAATLEDGTEDLGYNPDGTYKDKGRKESYIKLDKTVGEGDKVKLMFAAMNFGKLKRNFAFIKKEDPLFPNTRRISLPDIYGTKSSTYWVSPAFWAFVLDEYTRHLTDRIVEDEERSNCFKKGAHKRWRECDFTSERVNRVRLPPKGDFNKAPLWDV